MEKYTYHLWRRCALIMAEMACKNQCNALGWDDIRPICAGVLHTVGLKADGTIVAVGENSDGQCDVGDWTNIQLLRT